MNKIFTLQNLSSRGSPLQLLVENTSVWRLVLQVGMKLSVRAALPQSTISLPGDEFCPQEFPAEVSVRFESTWLGSCDLQAHSRNSSRTYPLFTCLRPYYRSPLALSCCLNRAVRLLVSVFPSQYLPSWIPQNSQSICMCQLLFFHHCEFPSLKS